MHRLYFIWDDILPNANVIASANEGDTAVQDTTDQDTAVQDTILQDTTL